MKEEKKKHSGLHGLGGVITAESRCSSIALYARTDNGIPRDAVFIPFCYQGAAATTLTNPVLPPFGKIPEFKCCAVRVSSGWTVSPSLSYGRAGLSPPQNNAVYGSALRGATELALRFGHHDTTDQDQEEVQHVIGH